MLNKVLSSSRYIVLIAVICCLVAALTLLVVAGVETFRIVVKAFSTSLDGKAIKLIAITFIEVIDVLLLGTVFYITALGLYELFIDEGLSTPTWLHITELDDLKNKLIGVVVVILVVLFLGQAVNWDGGRSIVYSGAGIAMVIIAVSIFLGWRVKKQ